MWPASCDRTDLRARVGAPSPPGIRMEIDRCESGGWNADAVMRRPASETVAGATERSEGHALRPSAWPTSLPSCDRAICSWRGPRPHEAIARGGCPLPSGCWCSATSEFRTRATPARGRWTLRPSASRLAGCFANIWVPAGWERRLKAQAHHRPITATERPAQIGARRVPHITPNGSCVAFATPPPAADRPLQTRHTRSCRGPRPRSPNGRSRSASRS
jgi:hypothetical protein